MPDYFSRAALHSVLRYQLRRSTKRLGLTLQLGSALLTTTRHRSDVMLKRAGERIEIALPESPADLVFGGRDNITTYLYLFAHCPISVQSMSCACNDGHEGSDARFAPSSRAAHVIPLPDRYFVLRNGFEAERRLAETEAVAWAERRDTIVWRGGANGVGIHPLFSEDATNPRVIQRARLCMLTKDDPRIDAKITSGQEPNCNLAAFAPMGLTGQSRAERQWLGDKFAIDIDGWTNTWSNLLIRMHFGCCVLKIESPDGYRQWWYDRLVPWEHFIPVRADMSDLSEKIDWARSNDRESEAIAARGQQLARSMTLSSETAAGVELIERNWN